MKLTELLFSVHIWKFLLTYCIILLHQFSWNCMICNNSFVHCYHTALVQWLLLTQLHKIILDQLMNTHDAILFSDNCHRITSLGFRHLFSLVDSAFIFEVYLRIHHIFFLKKQNKHKVILTRILVHNWVGSTESFLTAKLLMTCLEWSQFN